MAFDPLARARVVVALRESDGEIADDSGQATAILAERVGRRAATLTTLLSSMEEDGEVLRDVRGKRTYAIVLGDVLPGTEDRVKELASFHRRVVLPAPRVREVADDEVVEAEPEAVPAPEPVAVAVEHLVPGAPDDGGVDPTPVTARDLLARITSDMTALVTLSQAEALEQYKAVLAAMQAERDEARERLAMTLDENQRLRIRHREATDEVKAMGTRIQRLTLERNTLQQNLDAAMRDARKVVNHEVHKQVDRVMRQAPTSSKGD